MFGTHTWRIVTRSDDPGLKAYLANNEPRTTVMSERYRTERLDRRLKKGGRFYLYGDSSVVYHGPGGFYYPAGLTPSVPAREEFRQLMGTFVRLYAIMGQREDVFSLAGCFAGKPTITVDYFLFRHPPVHATTLPEPPIPGISVKTPDKTEWKRLLPLHLAYEAEEVRLPGRAVNMAASKATLNESLQTQLVLVAYHRGEAVARVATNARGYRTDQIGGVYTDPAWRGRGLARFLMTHLMVRLAEEGKGTSLFVKTGNTAALHLYERLGFSFESDFRISYYN